jgi:NhaA family Na+:H+ antiporter
MEIEQTSGVLLLICTVAALAMSNSAWAETYVQFWHTSVVLAIGSWRFEHTLEHLVNDGLMTLFFFVVGLEVKREMVLGELRMPRKAALPILAALGGMIFPAAVYLFFEWGQPGERGWGIPMATDIAFVIGFLSLLGTRVPAGLKIILLSLAIVDDIGAVVVIALFYSATPDTVALAWGAMGLMLCVVFNRIGVRRLAIYFMLGVLIWFAFLKSGIHPTIAGVILGLLTPASAWVSDAELRAAIRDAQRKLDSAGGAAQQQAELRWGLLEVTAREAVSPLERLERGLHPWVAYGIMPLFALANAGVPLNFGAGLEGVTLATALGLLIGKPVGIFLLSWLAIRMGAAQLPSGVDNRIFFGAACLGGIGFTMALFIANLAFRGPLLDSAKIGVLAGSMASSVLGLVLLHLWLPRRGQSLAARRQGNTEHLDRSAAEPGEEMKRQRIEPQPAEK